MRQLKLTLEAYLKLPNPVISEHDGEKLNDGTNGGTSRNISWNTPTAIRKWKHFKRDIFDLFNDEPLRNILQTEYTLNNFSDLPPFPFRDVRDEDTLEALLIKSNQSIVCEALDVAHSATQAKTDLKSSLPEMQVLKSHGSIYMARGGQSVFSRFELGEDAKLKKSKHKYYYRPDWAGVRRSDSQEKPRNLLPGDTKLSKLFNSGMIDTGPTKNFGNPPWYWPIKQIFTYCMRAGVRYGYLITDYELIVVRIRPKGPNKGQSSSGSRFSTRCSRPRELVNQATLDFEAIPWSHKTSDKLTVNLALWGLHLMAARDGTLTEEDYVQQSQTSNEPNTQDSLPSVYTPDAPELPKTPDRDPLIDENRGNEINLMSQTSDVRQMVSGFAIGEDENQISPTAAKRGRKRRGEHQSGGEGKQAKRGRKGRNQSLVDG